MLLPHKMDRIAIIMMFPVKFLRFPVAVPVAFRAAWVRLCSCRLCPHGPNCLKCVQFLVLRRFIVPLKGTCGSHCNSSPSRGGGRDTLSALRFSRPSAEFDSGP